MSGSIYDTTRKQYELLFILRGKLRLTSIDFFFLFVDNKTGMGGDSSLQVVCWWRFWLAAVSHLSIMLNNSFTVKRLYLSAINWTPKIASLRKEKWNTKPTTGKPACWATHPLLYTPSPWHTNAKKSFTFAFQLWIWIGKKIKQLYLCCLSVLSHSLRFSILERLS